MIPLFLLAGPASAAESSSKTQPQPRTIEVSYEGGAVPFVYCFDCPTTFSFRGERFLSVEVMDAASPTGYVDILWSTGGHGHDSFEVCGKTDEPQRIPPNTEITIYPWVVPDVGCPTGLSTAGTVKLTFSRKP